jgi:hypothetical protein
MNSRQNSISTIISDQPVRQQRLSAYKCILESFTHYESKFLNSLNRIKV